jgi:hypothetical protein
MEAPPATAAPAAPALPLNEEIDLDDFAPQPARAATAAATTAASVPAAAGGGAEEAPARDVALEVLPVPSAVFGGIKAKAGAAAADGEGDGETAGEPEPQGAMARLKRLKR